MDVRKFMTGRFITVEDLREGNRIERIAEATEGKYGKINLRYESTDLSSVNATNLRTLSQAFGYETKNWVGRDVELYIGDLEYQGRPQDGVLIRPIAKRAGDTPELPLSDQDRDPDGSADIPF